jgi:hypothetical protein
MRPDVATQVDWAELLDTALTAPGHLGDTYNRFTTYSFGNQVMLYMQGAEGPVATYDRWKKLGRQVVRGSKAYTIIRPITVKAEDVDGEEVAFTRFKPVRCLFTYDQTEGEELPPVEVPGWDVDTALERLDIKRRPFKEMNGNLQGYSWLRNIAVNPAAKYPMKTTVHEIGHVVLGHTAMGNLDYLLHRGVREFQAESTAYLTLPELDLMTEEQATVSRGYVQRWLKGNRPSDRAIRQVFSATDTILKAGRAAPEPGPDE